MKFEDDRKTALSGNDVWENLAQTGDAVRPATGLAGSYLHQLLDLSDRNYTLSEVTEKFWRDPVFPMIPDESVARRAIFGALRPDEDGLAWQLVTAGGDALHVTAPEQLLINSSEQYVTIAPETEEESDAGVPGTTGGAPATTPSGGSPEPAGPVHYRVHDLTVTNRSLTDRESREQLFQLISAIADALDPTSRVDLQVANIRIELNAAAGDLDHLADKAGEAGAQWATFDEDF